MFALQFQNNSCNLYNSVVCKAFFHLSSHKGSGHITAPVGKARVPTIPVVPVGSRGQGRFSDSPKPTQFLRS